MARFISHSNLKFVCIFLFEQGEKNLVYAELMLKPSPENQSPDKNSTEYAEIVYVSPPGGVATKETAKKA